VAKGYHKLLAYKDEYEVARLHLATEAKAREAFDGDFRLKYHLAPPMLPGKDAAGRPKKREFGPWIGRLYPVLARLKILRGTPLDPSATRPSAGWSASLIRQYQADMAEFLPKAAPRDHGRARGAGRAAALHPRLRPGQGAERAARRETARGPDRPSAGGRCPMAEAAE
jgi:indolepyruvate ferredoxin oxidoreductase